MSGQRPKERKIVSPGPAEYNLDKAANFKLKASPNYHFGSQQRIPKDNTTKKLVPGPGEYQLPQELKQGPVFSKSKRDPFAPKEGPGPGQYKIPVQVADVPAYLIPGQKEEYKFV